MPAGDPWRSANDVDMSIQVVLFDLDDTLYDHAYSSRQGLRALHTSHRAFNEIPFDALVLEFNTLLEEMHVRVLAGEISPDEARLARLDVLLRRRRYRASADELQSLSELYRTAALQAQRAIPGSTKLLGALRARGLRIGIVTNNFTEEQWAKLRVCSLEPWVEFMVTAESAGVAKPRPEIFEAALHEAGVPRDATVMVGDSWESDIIGAQNVGIKAVWFNRIISHSPVGVRRTRESLQGVRFIHTFKNVESAISAILD